MRRRWSTWPWRSILTRRGVSPLPSYVRQQAWRVGYATEAVDHHAEGIEKPVSLRQYDVFRRVKPPTSNEQTDPSKWLPLLEPGLPSHLRLPGKHYAAKDALDIEDVAEILIAAQRPARPYLGVDLLCHLGISQDRWDVVVWLVKQLVERFGAAESGSAPTLLPSELWTSPRTLHQMTDDHIVLQLPRPGPMASVTRQTTASLDRLTGPDDYKSAKRAKVLQRAVLGQIWRSLGAMVIACTDGAVKPEVLEIIAYLHHHGIMPSSIYSRKPGMDRTAVQQPPTLHLLSSRILTSLSDAAWRAHERIVVEEAKAKGGAYASLRPEIPGTAYRVNVAGLRPEIWLELILWSCLHGGWVREGAFILWSLCRLSNGPNSKWKPLSWRSLMPVGHDELQDWGKLDYYYNTRTASTLDLPDNADTKIARTVSSEVVNAYIDALLSELDVGVGETGLSLNEALSEIHAFRQFLERSGLTLGGGSWDAVISRLVDSQGDYALTHATFDQLVRLSPGFGGEVISSNTQHLPSYVLDGGAAIIGLAHQALRLQIRAANVDGVLRMFRSLQRYTDTNKRRSLEDFFETVRQAAKTHRTIDGLFSSNYDNIDYPAFDPQIPPTILGPFLEMVTDAKAYDIGKWLLSYEEVDGPLIPERLYNDPAITPALIKLAAQTHDGALLSKLVSARASQNALTGEGPTLPQNVLQSFFDTQVSLRQWQAATRILEHLAATEDFSWNIVNLSNLARMLFVLRKGALNGDAKCEEDLTIACTMFSSMVNGFYDSNRGTSLRIADQVSTILVVMSSIDAYWTSLCSPLLPSKRYYRFNLTAKAFNLLLQGSVDTDGVAAGMCLVDMFWPQSVRRAQSRQRRASRGSSNMSRVPPSRRSSLDAITRQRSIVHLPVQPEKLIIFHGGLEPNFRTIGIIFFEAVHTMNFSGAGEELEFDDIAFDESDSTVSGLQNVEAKSKKGEGYRASHADIVTWSLDRLHELGMDNSDIVRELSQSLPEEQLERLKARIPRLLHMVEASHFGEDAQETPIESENR